MQLKINWFYSHSLTCRGHCSAALGSGQQKGKEALPSTLPLKLTAHSLYVIASSYQKAGVTVYRKRKDLG